MLDQLEALKNPFWFFNTKTAFLEFIINILMCFTELQEVIITSYQSSSIIWMIKNEKVISSSLETVNV